MKKTRLIAVLILVLLPAIGYSQFWTRSTGTPGVPDRTFLTNLTDYLGVGTTTPSSTGNKFDVVSGGVMFQSTQGGKVRFENPNLEEGMAVFTNTAVVPGTTLYRGDVRLNSQGLKLGCTSSTSPTIPSAVPTSNLMYITPAGKFGIGMQPTSTTTAKLEIDAGSGGGTGLRFTRPATTIASNGNVLTLNAAGDVVSTTDQAGPTYTAGNGISFSGTTINSTWTQTATNIANNNSGNVNINLTPSSKLEVNSGVGYTSGLKFTNLDNTNFSAAIPSSGLVLTLNNTGDVVLTTDAGMVYGPGTGISMSGPIINSTWTQTGTNIFNNNTGNVGIGVTPTSAKLHVLSTNDFGIKSINNSTTSLWPIGVLGESDLTAGIGNGGNFIGGNTGVYGKAEQDLDNLGSNGGSSIYDLKGLDGYAHNIGVNNSRSAIGVKGEGYTEASISNAIGVYGYAYATNGTDYGIYGDAATYAGYFNGNVYKTGTDNFSSDRKLKKNIESLNNALDNVMKLKPSSYEFRNDEYAQMNLPKGKRFGFIAQDLEQVFPLLVTEARHPASHDKQGNIIKEAVDYKAVSYIEIIPVLTKAIQEQQAQIDAQQKQIEELKGLVANSNSTHTDNVISKSNGYLSQNVPNPFTQNTLISYKLPANTKTSAIGIYDLNGREIKTYTLSTETAGSITIDGGTLQPGMYVYSLIINGSPFETKKMILNKQ